jgi:hypothetical protein
VTVQGNGKQSRSFINIDLVAKALNNLLSSNLPSGTYNLVERSIRVFDIVDDLKQLVPDLEFIFINQHLKLHELKVPGNTPLAEPETRPAERSPDAAAAPATRTAALPGPSALAAAGIDVPPLMLQLHVYDSDSAKRFVIINGRRYAEGARLNEGPELVTIEKRGVVLRQQGRDFLLLPE